MSDDGSQSGDETDLPSSLLSFLPSVNGSKPRTTGRTYTLEPGLGMVGGYILEGGGGGRDDSRRGKLLGVRCDFSFG